QDPVLDWSGGQQAQAEGQPATGDVPAAPQAPPQPGPPPAAGGRELDWARRHARRLLVAGVALAVTAAACLVAVARPWTGEPTGLPASSVGLIDSSGGRVGAPVSVGSPSGIAYGDGSVWATDSADGTLFQINPATHAIEQRIGVGSEPTAVTVTGADVWV